MFKAMLQEGIRLTRGNSIWVFLLLGIEAIKTYRSNPFFEYDYPDPIQCGQLLTHASAALPLIRSRHGRHLSL